MTLPGQYIAQPHHRRDVAVKGGVDQRDPGHE
jgi:hypothetical protein